MVFEKIIVPSTAGNLDIAIMLQNFTLEEREHTFSTFADTYLKVFSYKIVYY